MTTTDLSGRTPPGTGGPRILSRINDWLVAPGASRGELAATYIAATAGTVLALGVGVSADFSTLTLVVVALVAFDGFGGAVANATPALKRRFHGDGRGPASHLAFLAAHVVQPAALAVTVLASGLALTLLAVPTPLAWFAPVLFVKLLLGHLLPGEAAR